ncbi:MAG: addiction module protein [Chloroflexi bacterium]|nr:addiction module protein [Chloroflexota bacterium]
MNWDTSSILRELLKLPPEARAALAGSLLDSIDETVDPDLEAAGEMEIVTRLRELDNSDVKTVPWSEARRIIVGE